MMMKKSTFSFKKIALSPMAENGTKKTNELTSAAPNFSIPKK